MVHGTGSGSASPPQRLVAAGVLVVAVLVMLIAAFAWPATNIGPRQLPLAVAGPDQAVAGLTAQLSQVEIVEGERAFEITQVADEAAAEQAIQDREVYGAIVVGPQGPQLLVASAASPAVAQLLIQGTGELAQGQPLPVTDVVPTDLDDPRGTGFAASLLPMVLGGIALGAVVWLTARTTLVQLTGLVVLATAAGFAAAATLQYGFSVLGGSYLLNSLVIALAVLALAAPITGLGRLFGRPGIGIGAAVMVLFANPWSGITSAPEMLPQPWGAIGAAMPPGAGGSLLRSTAFFDGAGATAPIIVLAAWAVAGLVLVVLGGLRRPARESSGDAEWAQAHVD